MCDNIFLYYVFNAKYFQIFTLYPYVFLLMPQKNIGNVSRVQSIKNKIKYYWTYAPKHDLIYHQYPRAVGAAQKNVRRHIVGVLNRRLALRTYRARKKQFTPLCHIVCSSHSTLAKVIHATEGALNLSRDKCRWTRYSDRRDFFRLSLSHDFKSLRHMF